MTTCIVYKMKENMQIWTDYHQFNLAFLNHKMFLNVNVNRMLIADLNGNVLETEFNHHVSRKHPVSLSGGVWRGGVEGSRGSGSWNLPSTSPVIPCLQLTSFRFKVGDPVHDDVMEKQRLVVDFDVAGEQTTEILHIPTAKKGKFKTKLIREEIRET